MLIVDDIIWLDTIIEKLAWKHNVLTHEVEETLGGSCKIFRKEFGRVEGEHLYNAPGENRSREVFICLFYPEIRG